MKQFSFFLKTVIKIIAAHKKLSLIAGGGLVILLALVFGGGNSKPEYTLAAVTRQNLKQTVSVTGKVKSEQEISLGFERSGRLDSLPVKVGDRITTNGVLAELENSELRSQIKQAEATLAREKVRLAELRQGTRQEELQVYETKLLTAQNTLTEAKVSALTTLQSVYANTEDAIRNKINQIFDAPYSYYPTRIKFTSIYPDTERKLCSQKESIEYLLNDWKTSLSGLTSNTDISLELNKTKKNLETLKGFADTVALLINAVASNDVNSATQISAWRTDIAASRNTIISSMATIDTTTDELLSASLAVQLAQDELNLKRAGSTKEQIQLQELQISQAQASLENIEAQLNKTILRAPITSLVTKVSADVGEIVSPNTPFLLMISDNQYKVEVNAPEVEIAKIHLQDKAVITLDAYGDSINFEAVVGLIDPSETVIDSVPTYKTTLFFSQEDGRIKSGMTANITIITAEKQNVLVIPQRAIQRQNGKKYVQVLNRQKIVEEQEVTIGIVSSSGLVEILSGLGENQQVIIP